MPEGSASFQAIRRLATVNWGGTPQILDRLLIEERIPKFLQRFTHFDAELTSKILSSMKRPQPMETA
jgi:hypothetical protein